MAPRKPIPQGPPPLSHPLINSDGTVTAVWGRWLLNSYEREGGAQDGIYEIDLAAGFGDATVADLAAQTDELSEQISRLQANNTDAIAAEINSRIDGLQADVNRALAASGQDFLSEVEELIAARVEGVKASLLAAISEDIEQTVSDIRDQVINANNGVAQLRGEDTVSYLQNLNTDGVPEGSINLYFTVTRARSSISATGSLAYNTSTGVLSYTTPNSDGITEGTTNLYFTVARARASVSASGDLSYNSTTGVFSYSTPANSATATKWATPRTLSFIGNVTGSGSVDGSTNVATTLTIANGAVTTAMLAFTLATVATSGAYTDLTGRPTLGTAAAQNTGTSGGNVPLLNGANTWASAQTFSTEISQGTRTVGVAVQAGTYTIKDAAGNPVTLLTT